MLWIVATWRHTRRNGEFVNLGSIEGLANISVFGGRLEVLVPASEVRGCVIIRIGKQEKFFLRSRSGLVFKASNEGGRGELLRARPAAA